MPPQDPQAAQKLQEAQSSLAQLQQSHDQLQQKLKDQEGFYEEALEKRFTQMEEFQEKSERLQEELTRSQDRNCDLENQLEVKQKEIRRLCEDLEWAQAAADQGRKRAPVEVPA
jgi:predicted RNase H-like nuclease (RuvC/YqgF family)